MSKSMLSFLLLLIAFEVSVTQVAYPEAAPEDKKKSNLAGRTPLYSPTRCRQNELLYPGDQRDDWICDCAPTTVFYPETESCYPVFRQGPCEKEHILVLGRDKVLPECIPNACKIDGQIQIKNVCYTLGRNEPCKNPEYTFVLGVDPSTLLVDCIKQSVMLVSRVGEDADAPNYNLETVDKCQRGSKRAQQGRCPSEQLEEVTTTIAPE